jgi:hypothetical protein
MSALRSIRFRLAVASIAAALVVLADPATKDSTRRSAPQ